MKYIKLFEAKSKEIMIMINISLFPNCNGLKEDEEPTTGTWTSFCSYSHDRDVGQKLYDIIWRKYFGKEDPCKDENLGPCRPEFESYPQELADLLIYIGEEVLNEPKIKERIEDYMMAKKYNL